MERVYKNCQSCGMPLTRDERGGGSNADGTLSKKFCSKCYQLGIFTQPDITMKEMQALVKGKLKEFGMPSMVASLYVDKIPKLERWKK